MAKESQDKPVRRLAMHQGKKYNQPNNALNRHAILFHPSSETSVNHKRLPGCDELASMSLAYREEPVSDGELFGLSDRLLSDVMLIAVAGVLSFVTILPVLPWSVLLGFASLISFSTVIIQFRKSAFSASNFLLALFLPLLLAVAFKGASFLIVMPILFSTLLAIVTVIVYGVLGPAPFSFYRDWLLTEPRLKPATRKTQSLPAAYPAIFILIALLAMAVLLPLLSNWLAMGVVAATSLVWISGNAVHLSWSATKGELRRSLQGMREIFAHYTMYGLWATRAPGVWYPKDSCGSRLLKVALLCIFPTLTLSTAWSGFVLWDLPFVSGHFKTACVEKIDANPELFATFRNLTPSIDWKKYPKLADEELVTELPESISKRIKGTYEFYHREYREELRKHNLSIANKNTASYRKKLWVFYKESLGNATHIPMLVALLGLASGDTFFLWIIALALALAAILPILMIVASLTPTIRSAIKARELVDTLDVDDRCEWQWYVDRVRSSPHRATEPLGIPVQEKNHLFLGVDPTADFPVLLDRSLLAEHAYLVGDSGSGKTSLGLMPLLIQLIRGDTDGHGQTDDSDLSPPPPIVVLDLKGDPALFNMMRREAERRSPDNPDAFLFFTPEQGRDSCYFNPFQSLVTERRSTLQLCQILLDSLNLNHGEGYGRSYYTRRSRQTLFEALSMDPQPRSMDELHGRLQEMARHHETQDVFELLATVESLTQYPQLALLEPNSPEDRMIHMQKVLQEGQVVYFWLPSALESVSVREIGKLALFSMLTAAIDRQRDGKPVQQAYLVIDEFQRLASENFKIILEQARSFGIAALLANQSRADLKLHDVDLRPSIDTNTRFKQFFSVTDPLDMKSLSDLSGEELMTTVSRSTNYGKIISKSISSNDVLKPRLMRNDILSISDHPLDSIVHVSRGSGYSQFGGKCVHLRTTWPMTKSEYDELAAEPWPSAIVEDIAEEVAAEVEPSGMAVSEHSPEEIDREAQRKAAQLRDEAMKQSFEKYDYPSPPEEDAS